MFVITARHVVILLEPAFPCYVLDLACGVAVLAQALCAG